MKIDYFKINGFGNLQNKEIELSKNINLIYGKNEAGKTTLLKAILAMFYGLSSNKKGKDISDFERYKPWKDVEFSGKMKYELDSGEKFEVFREFSKKNPKIYNEQSEDISKNFNIDKSKGNQFFYEQTKMDEDMFMATGLIKQQGVVLDKDDKNLITQKIANILSTGEDNISYQKSIKKLDNKLVEEVGTAKTLGRPLNIVLNEMDKIKQEQNKLKIDEEKRENIKTRKEEIKEDIDKQAKFLDVLKQIKEIKTKINLEEEKIKTKETVVKDYEQKIESTNDINKDKKANKILPIVISVVLAVILFVINKTIGLVALAVLTIINIVILCVQNSKKKEADKREKSILEKNQREKQKEIEDDKNVLKNKVEEIKKDVISSSKISADEIENIFDKTYEQIGLEISKQEDLLSSLKLRLNTAEIEEKNIEEDLEHKAELEEKLQELERQKEELNLKGRRIKLAEEALTKAYSKMKEQITPKFTSNLARIAGQISNNKYKNIKFNDVDGILVELENGEYLKADRLSIGTIDQLYLALRLSVFEEITKEKMPIILDESFAYYDNERLENILKYLGENYKENQILLFTCTEREMKIFEKLKIEYNKIIL